MLLQITNSQMGIQSGIPDDFQGFSWIEVKDKVNINAEREYLTKVLDDFSETPYQLVLKNYIQPDRYETLIVSRIEKQHTRQGDTTQLVFDGGLGFSIQFTPALIFNQLLGLRNLTTGIVYPIYGTPPADDNSYRHLWNGMLLEIPAGIMPGDILVRSFNDGIRYDLIAGMGIPPYTHVLVTVQNSKGISLEYVPLRSNYSKVYRPFYNRIK